MRSAWLGVIFALSALSQARARAEPAEPLWPPDCTRDMPRDGLVLLDREALGSAQDSGGAAPDTLEVRLLRSADGAPVDGALATPDWGTTSLLPWRSQAPLEADTEYKIEVRRKDAQAVVSEPGLSGYFTTGSAFLAPLAFSGRPAVRLLAQAPRAAAEPAPELLLVRIALPPLSGGLAQRTLRVTAAWSERPGHEPTEGLRARHEQSAIPGETLGFELEAQLGDAAHERCLEITARDDLGHELALEPELCVSLPARSSAEPASDALAPDPADAPPPDDAEPGLQTGFDALASHQVASAAPQADGAGGCTLSRARGAPAWPWVLSALPALVRRRRRRFLPGKY
jgi:hypothetical protein